MFYTMLYTVIPYSDFKHIKLTIQKMLCLHLYLITITLASLAYVRMLPLPYLKLAKLLNAASGGLVQGEIFSWSFICKVLNGYTTPTHDYP